MSPYFNSIFNYIMQMHWNFLIEYFTMTEKSFRFYKVINYPRIKRSFVDLINLSPKGVLRFTLSHKIRLWKKIIAISCYTQISLFLLLGVTQASKLMMYVFRNLFEAQNIHSSESKSWEIDWLNRILRCIGNISRNYCCLARSVLCWEPSERATDKLETTV